MKYFKNNQNQILNTESTDERYLTFLAKGGYVEISESEYNELANPKPSLETLKAEKLQELKSKADIYDEFKCKSMFIVSSLGFRVNADMRSQKNMEALYGRLANGASEEFRNYDDEFVNVTKEQFGTLLTECTLNGLSLYHQKWNYEKAIAKATTEAELEAIEINFEMKDFSK